eukprot:456838_1
MNNSNYFKWENKNNDNFLNHLTSNEIHDKSSKIIYFDISTFTHHFLHQRRPFYESAVIEEYDWPILYIMKSIIFKPTSLSSISTQYNTAHQPIACTEIHGNLNGLIASHPRFGSFKYERTVDHRGKGIFLYTISLFDKKNGFCMASMKCVNREFTKQRVEEIEKMRKYELKQYKKDSNEIEYTLPYFVGYSSKKYVFLSNLKQINSYKLFCNGLCTFNKAFTFHPWVGGSGDHINSTHVMDILYQFSHLIVRNGNQYNELKNIFNKLKCFDSECNVTIYKWDVLFLKYLELDYKFSVVLNNIQIEN